MRITKGLPSGLLPVKEELQPVVRKIQQLGDQDLRELDSFIDYLLNGPGELSEAESRESSRIFDFMTAGLAVR